jgi:putative heme-binding domain-containing protein
LTATSSELRKAAAAAIAHVPDRAVPLLDELARRKELAPAVVPELRAIFASPQPVMSWQLLGPFSIDAPLDLPFDRSIERSASYEGVGGRRVTWRSTRATDARGLIDLGNLYAHDDDRAAYGYAELRSATERTAQTVVGSDDSLTVWLNGKKVYEFSDRRLFEPESARFDVTLRRGLNRIVIRCGNRGGEWQFAVAVTEPHDFAFLKAPSGDAFNPESYRAVALKGQGSPEKGRRLFHDLKGLACIKCHAVGKEGGFVGPELSNVGAKYPRDELIAAVLYPSAKISQGYEPTSFALADGRVLTGIVRNQSASFVEIQDSDAKLIRIARDRIVEIQDSDAKLIRIARDRIEAQKPSGVSLMPSGLAQGLTAEDFADLIAYLESLKGPKP